MTLTWRKYIPCLAPLWQGRRLLFDGAASIRSENLELAMTHVSSDTASSLWSWLCLHSLLDALIALSSAWLWSFCCFEEAKRYYLKQKGATAMFYFVTEDGWHRYQSDYRHRHRPDHHFSGAGSLSLSSTGLLSSSSTGLSSSESTGLSHHHPGRSLSKKRKPNPAIKSFSNWKSCWFILVGKVRMNGN